MWPKEGALKLSTHISYKYTHTHKTKRIFKLWEKQNLVLYYSLKVNNVPKVPKGTLKSMAYSNQNVSKNIDLKVCVF